MSEDMTIELARLEREAVERIRAEFKGEDFKDLDTVNEA